MDRSGELRNGLIAFVVLMSFVLSGMAFLGVSPEDSNAAQAEEKDDYGYFWMDNKNPEPKVEYSWINVRGVGTELTGITSSSYSSYENIPLPDWDFPLYGTDYSTISVGSKGIIWFGESGYPSSYSSFPSSSDPNPVIAVCWGYPYTYSTSGGGVHYLTGTDDIGRYVCIEWNSNNYQQTYEVILWESGLIKMQFNNMGTSSSYQTGLNQNVGIVNSDASISNLYNRYQVDEKLNDGLAVEFSPEETNFANFDVKGTGGEDGHIAFAELEYYEISFDVIYSSGFGDLSTVKVYFGPPSLDMFLIYKDVGGLPQWSVGGGGEFFVFDITNSTSKTQPFSNATGGGVHASITIMFLFNIPLDGNISITLWARGKTALPKMMEIEDALYLDTVVTLVGDLKMYNEAGKPIPNEGFSKENENVTFTGVILVYNSTANVYPPNSSFSFRLTDEKLEHQYDLNASGRNISITYKMPNTALRKVFRFTVMKYNEANPLNVPFHEGKLIGEFSELAIRIDVSTPISPTSLVIKADSFKDRETAVDNDQVLFISWSSVVDSGSGVTKYRIWTTYAPGDDSIPWVGPKVTQYIWNGTTEGVFKIFVWAEDGVGHSGEWKDASIMIDMKDPYFVDFTPDPREVEWLRTLTPELTIGAKDNLTISDAISGVRPTTIEYSLSTSGIDNFEEWISADLHDDEYIENIDTVAVKLKPRFVEGKENYIRYRAKDYAGNGYAYSEVYNLNIDVTPVEVQDFFPTTNVWHDLDVLLDREVECYLYDETSGIMSNKIYYRISNGLDEKTGEHNWVTGIPQRNGWDKLPAKDWDRVEGDKLIHVHFKYEGFQEGEENYIQFMYPDVAGNGNIIPYDDFEDKMTFSKMYQIKINTQPVAVISEPHDFDDFFITDLITLDASDSYDIDVDEGNLKYEWFCHELNKSLGYEEVVDTVRFPAVGWYNITLYVGDSVHRYDPVSGEDKRSSVKLLIHIKVFTIDPEADDDQDGMLDKWEWENLLTLGFDDSDEDADGDGFTNIQEYNAKPKTDPWDKSSYPPIDTVTPPEIKEKAPFEFWLFMVILVAALIIAAIVVLIGYLRIQRKEHQDQTEEAEEEAMLATPQLDIPTMPPQIPMVDTSVPSLPAPAEGEVPPTDQVGEQVPLEGQPLPEEPVPQPEPVPAPVEPPVPEPAPVPDPVNPMNQQPQ
jgi:hypothetical protein